jgi:hypothetical protein
MPMTFTYLSLRRWGFEGFVTIAQLQADHCRDVPVRAGVYIALCEVTPMPRFSRSSRRPEWTLPLSTLRSRWVPDSPVVYIGKADATEAGSSLRKRVSRYLRAATSHTGGKRTWQLKDWDQLVIAWRVLPSTVRPKPYEDGLLSEHQATFGSLPFANG